MTEKPIEKPEDLRAYIAQLQEERERIRQLSEETAEEVYSDALADFHGERGARRITELAEQHGISFSEALTRWGNALAPRPPDLTRRAGLSPDEKALAPDPAPDDPDGADKDFFGFTLSEAT